MDTVKYASALKLPYIKKYYQELLDEAEHRDLSHTEFLDLFLSNVILIGSPGSGKTHYSIGLAIHAILEGKRVLFVSVPNLVIELKEAMSKAQLNAYKRKFERYDLVVLDELGYVSG